MMWEYMSFHRSHTSGQQDEFIERLNELGAVGWELVQLDASKSIGSLVYMKRPADPTALARMTRGRLGR